MSVSLIVATILVAGWNLTLTATALLTKTGPFKPKTEPLVKMDQISKTVTAEIGKPDLDARRNAWKRGAGISAAESVKSRITETQREVVLEAPYAEASVVVIGNGSDEVRRCSVCLN